jgi:hypothetical protein
LAQRQVVCVGRAATLSFDADAADTRTALMLAPQLFRKQVAEPLKYLALGVLFVNISIGGTLTSYAGPPVLMVAATWHWDSAFMFTPFGWKAAIAVAVNATVATFVLRKHLPSLEPLALFFGALGWPVRSPEAACSWGRSARP